MFQRTQNNNTGGQKMKSRMSLYPQLRRDFKTAAELGLAINRSREYVLKRLNGTYDFSFREMCMISEYLGYDKTMAREVCRKEA